MNANTDQELTFLAWVRPELGSLITAPGGGRAQAATPITLTETEPDGTSGRTQTQAVQFLIAGPADVVGLQPGAIVRRYPAPGTVDHESNRCPYVELADPTLPWRYTPAPTPTTASLHPWLVLLVGLEGSELVLTGEQVTIDPAAQADPQTLGAPASLYRFAHVQDTGGHRTTRLLSARPLLPGTDYLAVVVPAYDPSGNPCWSGAAAVTIPAYDYWRFHTAIPAGSFETLAARLQPGDAPASTGRATVNYPRLDPAPEIDVLGALVPRSPTGQVVEDPLPDAVRTDLAGLRLPTRDPQGRPIVSLPRYGEAWNTVAPEQYAWGTQLNLDPRHRGMAGLGLAVAISAQEDLVDDVMANLGALHEARQRVRHLTLGLAASRSVWQRRIPSDSTERLWLLGPAMNRLVTPVGSLADLATATDRTMATGTFSAAARRILRAGPARTALAAAPPSPAAVIAAANRQPPPPPAGIDGVPLTRAGLSSLDAARKQVIAAGRVNTSTLLAAADELAGQTATALQPAAKKIIGAMQQANQAGKPVPWAPALALLAAANGGVIAQLRDPGGSTAVLSRGLSNLHVAVINAVAPAESMPAALPRPLPPNPIVVDPGQADLLGMLVSLSPLQANDPTLQPVGVDALAVGVAAAFDPTGPDAPAATRVLATIPGAVDPAQPLAPPEPCVGLDRAAWSDLVQASAEWLLPGIGQLPEDSVIALESDPIFIDAYLTGLNTQLLGELRWRNIPTTTGCTPIRRFWGQADVTTGAPTADIVGLTAWSPTSGLGDPGHRPPGVTGQELVIVVRGELLLRYPTTLVYLVSAVPAGATAPNFDGDPDDGAVRALPGFRGQLAPDVFFFGFPGVDVNALGQEWLVFEEPPAGYRFANDVATAATAGHEWAAATLVDPVRVLIRGDSLDFGGTT
jgi:hypothetical protein